MTRRSLISTDNTSHMSPTGIRGIAAAGLVAALLVGATSGVASAAPDQSATTASVSTSPTLVSSAPATRARNTGRGSKATARERRSARDAIRQSVADRALRQVGDRYAAGAEGPDAFDCSGLTLFAWQAAGVQLTHYSAGQYQQVRRISPDAALPGDLVFYLTGGARHVGVYIGDGKIVNASDYGVGVIISPVRGTPWTNAHFTGFGRVSIPEDAIGEMIEKRRARR